MCQRHRDRVKHGAVTAAENAEVAHLHEARGWHVLKETAEKLFAGKCHVPDLLGAVIAIVKLDLAGVDGVDPAVGDGDAEDIAAQIVQDLATRAGMFRVNDPAFFPNGHGDAAKQVGFFQSGAKFCTKQDGQGTDRNQKGGVLGFDPPGAVGRYAASSHQHMNMRMKKHGPRPGVQHSQSTDARSQITRIASQFLQGIGSRPHHQAVKIFRMGSCDRVEFSGQSEGKQIVATRG